jgi:hypothetical protein
MAKYQGPGGDYFSIRRILRMDRPTAAVTDQANAQT